MGKATWVVAAIVLEWMGALVYLIVNHRWDERAPRSRSAQLRRNSTNT
ncbi:MAG: hypothetical protein JOZ98_05730 [Solirubrobacterales bacterium]|nr:hypothetical protein [Solirubrobacterales bacterium]MBV9422386.1 hypothetical protein [Solirubrobacterales bacterium]MBV9801503.1 hypothetical protein [Solirubrobacterales bacterium]